MNKLHKTVLITSSLLLLIGAGCTQSTTATNETVNTNNDTTTESNANTELGNDTVNTDTVVDRANTNETIAVDNTNVNTNTESDQAVDTSDWLTYTNEEHGFSVSYPESWSIMSEYDAETQEIILNDESSAFWLTVTSQLNKHQDFTPGISIQFKTDEEVEVQINEYNDNGEGLSETKIGKYSATVYNKVDIVYEKATIVPEKNLIIRVRTDENFVVDEIFQDIYESIQLD